jgi:hypothetical protein
MITYACQARHALLALPVGCFDAMLACDGLLVPQFSILGRGEGLGDTQRGHGAS